MSDEQIMFIGYFNQKFRLVQLYSSNCSFLRFYFLPEKLAA
jgi:hypothetical protein